MYDKTIFGSKSEKELFHKINTHWKDYLNIYPQIPPKNVYGYQDILNSDLSDDEKNFLFKTEFDFVICDKDDRIFLIIEFDGIKGGYSNDGKYYSFTADKIRTKKLNTKLKASELFGFELLIISFDEVEELNDSDNTLIILDGILGRYLSNMKTHEIINKKIKLYNYENTEELEMLVLESEVEADLKYNILVQETAKIQKRIGRSGLHREFLPDIKEKGLVGSIFRFPTKIELRDGKDHSQHLTYVKIYVRDINGLGAILVEDIGQYCLYRKVEKMLKKSTNV